MDYEYMEDLKSNANLTYAMLHYV